MAKGLFTSLEEIRFHYKYVQGNVENAYDPNARRNPIQTKRLCSKQKNKKIQQNFRGRTRH